jgi:hypothetical protein
MNMQQGETANSRTGYPPPPQIGDTQEEKTLEKYKNFQL